MAWHMTSSPDTLLYSDQVRSWMERFWREQDCAACGQNDWRAEGRLFMLQRMLPGEDETGRQGLGVVPGVGRTLFPVVCMSCGHTLLVGSQVAGINPEVSMPDDLSGLGD